MQLSNAATYLNGCAVLIKQRKQERHILRQCLLGLHI